MKIAVGSTNPVKVAAVRNMVEQVWPECEVVGVSVPSGVSDMPMSDDECIDGAKNRARAARETAGADLGFGLEGGCAETADGLMLVSWVVADHVDGRVGLGGSARIPLPEMIANRVRAGEELGPVMDDIVQETDTKHRSGAAGILTAELFGRTAMFESAVAYALSKFVAPQFY